MSIRVLPLSKRSKPCQRTDTVIQRHRQHLQQRQQLRVAQVKGYEGQKKFSFKFSQFYFCIRDGVYEIYKNYDHTKISCYMVAIYSVGSSSSDFISSQFTLQPTSISTCSQNFNHTHKVHLQITQCACGVCALQSSSQNMYSSRHSLIC